jgi:type IV pilus assembly protein PilC
MPQFAFQASDAQGTITYGKAEAAREEDIYKELNRRGLTLIECREKVQATGFGAKKIPLPEQVLFCRHLLALVRAGVPAHTALKDVTELSRNHLMRKCLKQIHTSVLHGSSLSAAFEAQGSHFDPLFLLLLRAGEGTGRLTQALTYLHESLGWKDVYTRKLKQMISYPAIQMVFATTAVLVLMFVAVPQIMQLFGFLGQDMPWYSVVLLTVVKGVGLGLGALLIAIATFTLFMPLIRASSNAGAVLVDGFLLRIPFFGGLLTKMALARLAQLFAAMLESGVSMNEALQALPRLTSNRALAAELEKIRQFIAAGQGFAASFERALHLPTYMVRLLKVGEDGEGLSESLKHVANLYQQESTDALEAILKGSSLFVTALVGFVLAAIVMGVVYPLYRGLGAVMGAG